MNTITKPSTTNIELSPQPVNRLNYIDNIRWFMIILVVLMHIKVTYAMEGSWYYVEKSPIDFGSRVIFAMYGSWVQAFFMGFLFFIAGYFIPRSYDKRGFSGFLKERLIRLGIPTLFFMVFLNWLTIYTILHFKFMHLDTPRIIREITNYFIHFEFLGGSGPMWFTFALLIFSFCYAISRLIFDKFRLRQELPSREVNHRNVMILILLISIAAFLIRWALPDGATVMNFQLGNFAQYIILFIVGLAARRHQWLDVIGYAFGCFWFRLALGIGIPLWLGISFLDGLWKTAAYALWESFFCVGICLGLLVIFRKRFNQRGVLSHFLSQNAFGVYVFHTPILVFISLTLSDWHIHPLLKFAIVALLTIPVCFGFSYLVRRIPVCRKIFS